MRTAAPVSAGRLQLLQAFGVLQARGEVACLLRARALSGANGRASPDMYCLHWSAQGRA